MITKDLISYRGGQLWSFWPWHVLSVDLLVGLEVPLPHLVPRHAVHLSPGPSEGDAQVLSAAQCVAQEGRPLKLPSAVQKGRLKVEEAEQATLGQVLERTS